MSSKLAKLLYASVSAHTGLESEVVAETSDESGTPIVEAAASVDPDTNPEFEAEHDAVDKVTALVRAAADATSAAEVVEEVQSTRRAVVEFKDDLEAVNEAEGGVSLESLPFVLIAMAAHTAAVGRPGLFVSPATEGLSEDARVKIDVSALEAIVDTLDTAHPHFLKASAGEFSKMANAIADALPEARDRLTTLLSDLQMDTRPLADGSIDLSPALKSGLSVQGAIPEDLVTYFATYAELGKQLCGEYAQRAGASAEALVGLLGSLNYDHTAGFWDTLKEVLEKVGDPRQALGKDSIAIGLPGGSSLFEANEAPQTDGNPTFAAMAEFITVNAPVVGCDTTPQDEVEDPQLPEGEAGAPVDGEPALEGFVGGLLGFLFGGSGWIPFVGPAIHAAVKAKRLKLREDIQTISKRIAAARNGQIDEVAKKGTTLPKGLKKVDSVEIIKSALLGQFFGGLYGIHQGSDLENLNNELKQKIAELEKELEAAGMSSLESIGLEDIDALAADAAADPAAEVSGDKTPPTDAPPATDPAAPADPVLDAAAVEPATDPGVVVDFAAAPAAPAADGLKALTRDQLRTLVKSILDLMDDGRVAETLKGLERNWQATKAAVVESQQTVRSITGDVKDQLGVQTEIVPRYVKCVHELSVWPIANFLANLVFTANTVALLGTEMVSGNRAAEPTPVEAAPVADPIADPAVDPATDPVADPVAEGVADVTDEAADGGDPTNVEPLTPDPTPDPDAPLSQPSLDDGDADPDAAADPAADLGGDDLGAGDATDAPPEGGDEAGAPDASADGAADDADPLAAAGTPPEGEDEEDEEDGEGEQPDPDAPTA